MYLISHPLHLQFTSVSLKSTDSHHHHIFLLTWLKLDLYSLRTIFFLFLTKSVKKIYTQKTPSPKKNPKSADKKVHSHSKPKMIPSTLVWQKGLSCPIAFLLITNLFHRRRWFYLFAFAHLLFFLRCSLLCWRMDRSNFCCYITSLMLLMMIKTRIKSKRYIQDA